MANSLVTPTANWAKPINGTTPAGGKGSPSVQPRRKSLIDFLNLVRGADPRDERRNQYQCQKALEDHYCSGKIVQKGGGQWQPVERGLDPATHDWPITKAAMAEALAANGGYLLPQDYSDALLFTLAEHSFIFPRANVIPMFSADLAAPRVDVETLQGTSGVSALLGGIKFSWSMEAAATETEPLFRMDNFHAWDLLGYAVVSNQWLQDAGAIQETPASPRPEAAPLLKAEHYLIKLFGAAAAWYAEFAFLQGMGANQQMPLGIVNSPAAVQVARAGPGTIAVADVAGMTSSLLPYSWNHAIWACSPTALSKIQQIGSYFINIELGGMYKASPRPVGVLSTLPLFVTDKLPPVGVKGDLVLFDPSLYVIAQRQEVVVDVSPDDAFQNNQTTYRIWMRLDGKPMTSGSIRLQDVSTSVSPFVVLKS